MSGALLARHQIGELLERTSRTFALAIPLLPEPLRAQVGLGYLLFRIADTFEDASRWPRERRLQALASYDEWLEGRTNDDWKRLAREVPPIDDDGCLRLLSRADCVLATTRALDRTAAAELVAHTQKTVRGMARYVARQDEGGGLVLTQLAELRDYAYVAAGIVGELLTRLFVLADARVAAVRDVLEAEAASFGEALQLVNILKDAPADRREGRVYLPVNVPREVVIGIARTDLVSASRYVKALRDANADRGVVAFCELPRRLAVASLDHIERGTSKLAREEVMRIYAEVTRG